MPDCPFCAAKMRRKSSQAVAELITGPQGAIAKMMGGGMERSRGKWLQCPKCMFVSLFEKAPKE